MHQILAAFFALLFSFGHAQTVRHAEADAFVPPAQYAAGLDYAVPSREQIVEGQYSVASASYSVDSCNGCQLTTVSSGTR